jgi:hypothetical protein
MTQISTAVSSLKGILEDQQHQVNDLRRSLTSNNNNTPIIPNIVIQNHPAAQSPQQQQPQPIIIEKEIPFKKPPPVLNKIEKTVVSNRWNQLPLQTNEELAVPVEKKIEMKTVTEVANVEFEPTPKVEEKKPMEVVREAPVTVVKHPTPAAAAAPVVVVKKEVEKPASVVFVPKKQPPPPTPVVDDKVARITFPLEYNPTLEKVIKFDNNESQASLTGLTVEMKNDSTLTNDEIIADLRTKIAMQTNLKIRQVSLVYEGKVSCFCSFKAGF